MVTKNKSLTNIESAIIGLVGDDIDSYNKWISLGVKPSHLIKLDSNYWEIGPGPSGPDTEIFYDRGEKYDKEGKGIKLLQEEIENDRYIEIWNNVLSQFNATEGLKEKNTQNYLVKILIPVWE